MSTTRSRIESMRDEDERGGTIVCEMSRSDREGRVFKMSESFAPKGYDCESPTDPKAACGAGAFEKEEDKLELLSKSDSFDGPEKGSGGGEKRSARPHGREGEEAIPVDVDQGW
jgi:hypothetical protein